MPTLQDLMYAYYRGAVSASAGGGGAGSSSPIADSSQVANKYTSLTNVGTATAPAAGAAIVSVPVGSSGGGYYRARVTYMFGPTAEATAANNFQLKVASGVIGGLPSAVGVNNDKYPTQEFYINVANSQSVTVNAIAAGSTGAIYTAILVLDRLA